MSKGFRFQLTSADRKTIHYDFSYSARPKSGFKIGKPDSKAIENADSLDGFARRGDRIFTPSAYEFVATLQSDTLANLRSAIQSIYNALGSTERIVITSVVGYKYIIAVSPPVERFQHFISVEPLRWGIPLVRLHMKINVATTFVEVLPPAPELITEGLEVYYDASQLVYTDAGATQAVHNDSVQEWHNRISNSYHAKQTNASFKPVWKSEIELDVPAVRISGLQRLEIQDNYDWNGGTFFAVYKPWNQGESHDYRNLFGFDADSGSSTARYFQISTNTGEINFGLLGSGAEARSLKNPSHVCVVHGTYDGATKKLYMNGVEVASTSGGGALGAISSLPPLVGAGYFTNSVVDNMDGWIMDLLFYNRVLTDEEQSSMVEHLRDKNDLAFNEWEDDIDGVGVDLWLSADKHVYNDLGLTEASDTEDVRMWQTRTRHPRDAFKESGSSPSLRTISGIKTLQFESGEYLRHNYYDGYGTVFIIGRYTGSTSAVYASYMGGSTAGSLSNWYVRSNTGHDDGRLEVDADDFPAVHTPFLYNSWNAITYRQSNSDGQELMVDGLTVDSSGAGVRVPVPYIPSVLQIIGGAFFNSVPVDFHVGEVAEIICAKRRMTDAELNTIHAYLGLKYSNVLSVLVGNPTEVLPDGLRLHLDASKGVYKNDGTSIAAIGDAVQHWRDQSGNGNNATQSNALQRPTLELFAGERVVKFDGSSHHLDEDYLGEVRSIYVVGKHSGPDSNAQSYVSAASDDAGAPTNAYSFHGNALANIQWTRQTTPFASVSTIRDIFKILSGTYNTTSRASTLSIDGVEVASVTGGTTEGIGATAVIGASARFDGSTDQFLEGSIAELLLYDVEHSVAQKTHMQKYLESKHATLLADRSQPISTHLELHLDANIAVYEDDGAVLADIGDDVEEWHDQSGNGNDVTQVTAANQPTLISVDGIRAIDFDGVDDYFDNPYIGEPATVYIVMKNTDTSGSNYRSLMGCDAVVQSWAYNLRSARGDGGDWEFHRRGLGTLRSGGIEGWVNYMCHYDVSNDDRALYVNNVVLNSSTATGTEETLIAPAVIGAQIIDGAAANFHQGYIAEVLVYSVVHNSYEREYMQGYLEAKYGALLTPSLPTENLELHLDANSGVYNDNGLTEATEGQTVEEWHDQSGNGNDATQTTTAEKPIFETVDGIPTITFDGIDDVLEHTYSGEPATVYVVMKRTTDSDDYDTVIGAGSSTGPDNNAYALFANRGDTGEAVFLRRGLTPSPNNARPEVEWVVFGATYDPSSDERTLHLDGAILDTETTTGTEHPITSPYTIGAQTFQGSITNWFQGSISELIIYSGAHDAGQVGHVYRHLKNKWATLS